MQTVDLSRISRRFRAVVKTIGTVFGFLFWIWLVVLLQPSTLMAPVLGQAEPVRLADFGLLAVLLAMIVVCHLLYAFLLAREQRLKDARADIATIRMLEPAVPLFLYLRSFEMGRSTLLDKLFAMIDRPREEHVEVKLADALERWGVFVSIGDRLSSYGASKIRNDYTNWQDYFEELARRAALVFLMPGPSSSIIWECGRVAHDPDLRAKTVWIMPPRMNDKQWSDLADLLKKEAGVIVPRYRRDALFILNDERVASRSMSVSELLRSLNGATPTRQAFAAEVRRLLPTGRNRA